MKKIGRLRGACDSCSTESELYGTPGYGEWLCLSCKNEMYPNPDELDKPKHPTN